jgi:hypothetical protein
MVDRDRKNRPAEILDAILITSQVVSPRRSSMLPKKVDEKMYGNTLDQAAIYGM